MVYVFICLDCNEANRSFNPTSRAPTITWGTFSFWYLLRTKALRVGPQPRLQVHAALQRSS